MPKPNLFISHRWAYQQEYHNFTKKLSAYGFTYMDYSVPQHDPLDVNKTREIKRALAEQVRQCNYFLIFANMAMAHSDWCKHEVETATHYGKPVLSVRPHGYTGNIPIYIQNADTEGGPNGFNTPAIIRKICTRLNWPLPSDLG
jgi:hypothetical protein